MLWKILDALIELVLFLYSAVFLYKKICFVPLGTVYVSLPKHEDQYQWNKVTTCVHNVYGGGERWVDQYGEMVITNKRHGLSCKLSFLKVSLLKTHQIFNLIFFDQG